MPFPALPSRPRTEVLQPAPATWVDWDVASLREVLRQHEDGQFWGSSLLCDFMLRDDRMKSTLGTRTKALLGLPFSLRQAREETGASALASELKTLWPRIAPRTVLGKSLEWSTLMGLSVAQLVWDTSDGRWVPELQWWHPQFVWWRQDIERLVANTKTGPVTIEPGDGQWFVHAPGGVYRGWMGGAVRSLALLTLLRQYALRDWARASEMYGLGVRKAYVPANCDPADRDRFYQQLANLGAEAALLLPRGMPDQEGFDLDIAAPGGAFTGELFERLGARCDMGITLELLGQNLTSEVKEGSLAAARVHGDVRQDFLEADAVMLALDLWTQVVRPWAAFNHGAPLEDAPMPTWDVTPPEDKTEASQTLLTNAQALEILARLGLGDAIDLVAVLKRFGLPLRPGASPRLALPTPSTTPAPPAPPVP